MSDLGNFVKRIRKIMWNDAGLNGDAQRIEQLAWMLFLKVYDEKENDWEFDSSEYISIIPNECRWRNWAHDEDGKGLTGDRLLNFVNNTLFPTLKSITITPDTPIQKAIVKTTFEDANQYMKDGVLLRQVINLIDDVDLGDSEQNHQFNTIYESILKELQSAGSSGEFYTPRAVTDFMAQIIEPKIGEKCADFACGTGGFLISWLSQLEKSINTTDDQSEYDNSIFGIEKKQFPYMLAVTNMLLHGIDVPSIYHDNSLLRDVLDYTEEDQFDVILMNPPYGGSEKKEVKNHFPADLASAETADLFMSVIMYRLKENGRAAVILPDSFLSSEENVKKSIKKKLMSEFNLHTIVRLPNNVFSPYTDLPTNILFFDKTGETKETWFYRLDMPQGYKHFSKTKPIEIKHFASAIEWWRNRTELADTETETYKAKKYTIQEISEGNYDLNKCGYPKEIKMVLSPEDTVNNYLSEKTALEEKLQDATEKLRSFLNGENEGDIPNIKSISDQIVQLDSAFNEDMRNSVLSAAMHGKLSEQKPSDTAVINVLNDLKIQEAEIDLDDDNYYDIPESWIWMPLNKLVNYMQRGKSPQYAVQEKIPVISQKCVQWDGFSIEKARFIDPDSMSGYTEERLLRDGDMLVNSTGLGTLGRAAIYKEEANQYGIAVADSHVTVVRLNTKLMLPEFLYAYWSNPSVQGIIESQTSGSTKQKELALKTLQGYLIPVPPIEEQKRILEKLGALLPAFQ